MRTRGVSAVTPGGGWIIPSTRIERNPMNFFLPTSRKFPWWPWPFY